MNSDQQMLRAAVESTVVTTMSHRGKVATRIGQWPRFFRTSSSKERSNDNSVVRAKPLCLHRFPAKLSNENAQCYLETPCARGVN